MGCRWPALSSTFPAGRHRGFRSNRVLKGWCHRSEPGDGNPCQTFRILSSPITTQAVEGRGEAIAGVVLTSVRVEFTATRPGRGSAGRIAADAPDEVANRAHH